MPAFSEAIAPVWEAVTEALTPTVEAVPSAAADTVFDPGGLTEFATDAIPEAFTPSAVPEIVEPPVPPIVNPSPAVPTSSGGSTTGSNLLSRDLLGPLAVASLLVGGSMMGQPATPTLTGPTGPMPLSPVPVGEPSGITGPPTPAIGEFMGLAPSSRTPAQVNEELKPITTSQQQAPAPIPGTNVSPIISGYMNQQPSSGLNIEDEITKTAKRGSGGFTFGV